MCFLQKQYINTRNVFLMSVPKTKRKKERNIHTCALGTVQETKEYFPIHAKFPQTHNI